MAKEIRDLEKEYHTIAPMAQRLCTTLGSELRHMLASNGIVLGVPIEHRVKTWESIAEKLERKAIEIESFREVSDLVGVRLIVVFRRDVEQVCDLLEKTFRVVHKDDKQALLGESQFGYQAIHYEIQLPSEWLSVPSLAPLKGLSAEIQVRTLSQHIWAAASHILQYKSESSVPLTIRRAIHRVSALLETVDLEFERVLSGREEYREEPLEELETVQLDVDLLARILDKELPEQNKKDEDEPYSKLLRDLFEFEVDTPQKLKMLLHKNWKEVLRHESRTVKNAMSQGESGLKFWATTPERAARGVFFTHVGLTRTALSKEFGERWEEYIRATRGEGKKMSDSEELEAPRN